MKTERLYIGGWFQRTSLHLSEIYDFLVSKSSPLALDPRRLQKLHHALHPSRIQLRQGNFEHLVFFSENGIFVKIYEDGLMVLGKRPGRSPKDDVALLAAYYEKQLSPALSFLFSLGAPIPKELAKIKTIYPYFFLVRNANPDDLKRLLKTFNEKLTAEIHRSAFSIYRGNLLYIIDAKRIPEKHLEHFVQEQIFLREFKGQLHRYLNLHRIIWEKIAEVKERGKMRGSDIGPFRKQLESYVKTVNLIDSRIQQMDTYIKTREAIAKADPKLKQFINVVQFRYETLADSLEYVKDLWIMTTKYVESSLALFAALQAQSTESSVKNLTVVTSMGVGATLIGLFSQKLPTFTGTGIVYFFILVFIGFSTNAIMKWIAMRRLYAIRDVALAKDLD